MIHNIILTCSTLPAPSLEVGTLIIAIGRAVCNYMTTHTVDLWFKAGYTEGAYQLCNLTLNHYETELFVETIIGD